MNFFFFIKKQSPKKLSLIFVLFFLINYSIKLINIEDNLNGVFTINSKLNKTLYFSVEKETLKLGKGQNQFNIISL
jgi:hypothetical protein